MFILKYYLTIVGFLIVVAAFLSSAGGVPQGVTSAPTEASHNSCGTCHLNGNFDVKADLKVLNKDNQSVTSYIPGEIYTVNLELSSTNNPRSYGFQLTVLEDDTNSDQGSWQKFGEKVKQINLTILQKQRRYICQSSPKSDGLFTAEWKAPDTNKGNITFYYAGLAINLNGNTSGDKHITGQYKLKGTTTAVSDFTEKSVTFYPNPAINQIVVDDSFVSCIDISDISGKQNFSIQAHGSYVDISFLSSGLYICKFKDKHGNVISTQKLIKL